MESIRLGFKNLGAVFSRSAGSLAIVLAIIAGVAMGSQFMLALKDGWRNLAVIVANTAEVFLIFAFLLEFCRLRHGRRAIGFIALWLFLLCISPVHPRGSFLKLRVFAVLVAGSGFVALSDTMDDQDWTLLFYTLLFHLGALVLVFLGWQRQWKRLLEKAG